MLLLLKTIFLSQLLMNLSMNYTVPNTYPKLILELGIIKFQWLNKIGTKLLFAPIMAITNSWSCHPGSPMPLQHSRAL